MRSSLNESTVDPSDSGSAPKRRRAARLGTIHQDAVAIYVYESTLEQILDFSEQDVSREVGGFLLGGRTNVNPPRIVIRHFLPALEARSQGARLTFTHETWAALNREAEQRFADQPIVGWHHTHPNFGVFLSAYDLFLHRHFFGEVWQVALVVDPVRQDFGFFQWRRGQVVDCGFVCVPA